MDFQNVNPLNAQLNELSGNLPPMTGDDPQFLTAWRVYSTVVWLIEIVHISATIPTVMYVSKEKFFKDVTVGAVVSAEAFFLFARMHAHRDLVSRLIRKLNDFLSERDHIMESIVRSILKPVQTPLKFYWISGCVATTMWSCISIMPVLRKRHFFYEDYRMPVTLSKQPFSLDVFLAENLIVAVSSMCIFTKKIAMDVYMINLVLLVTAQYRYVSTRLTKIFREGTQKSTRKVSKRILRRGFVGGDRNKKLVSTSQHYSSFSNYYSYSYAMFIALFNDKNQ